MEAVERCLAGITRGSDQNAGGTGLAGLAQGRGEQVRQHLQRHILERAGRTVPQLKQVLALAQLYHRCSICAAELLIGVGLGRKVRQLLRREVGQELAENERRAALVIALRKRFPIRVGKRGKRGPGSTGRRPVRYRWLWRMPRKPCAPYFLCLHNPYFYNLRSGFDCSFYCIANMYVWAIGNSVEIPPSCHNIFCIKLNALS